MTAHIGMPPAQGLYDPANEHDNCGVGFIANMGVASNGLPSEVQELKGYSLVVALMIVGTIITFFIRDTKPRDDSSALGH